MQDYVDGIRSGDRAILARAITLVESRSPAHQDLAQQVLTEVMSQTGSAVRVGITGVPGVGKSTMIENLGLMLTQQDHRVAVLAIDPTSSRTGGSILGDKTRMAKLASDPDAFIRPSPSSGTLGGVTRRTRETMLLCEAAGYDIVIVETVGVGQSETVVHDMVDFFLVLMLAGAGDELQGIKRGVLEMADMIAINKADGDNAQAAQKAAQEYARALHYMTPLSEHWHPPVITCSGLANSGLDQVWDKIESHRQTMVQTGEHDRRRREQLVRWMWAMVEDQLMAALRNNANVKQQVDDVQQRVADGALPPTVAARNLLDAFGVRARD